jgi:hypothetical protein
MDSSGPDLSKKAIQDKFYFPEEENINRSYITLDCLAW